MSHAVCRVCLAGSAGDDVRLYIIDDHLLKIYEKLTTAKLSSEDGKHNTLCYICYSQLQKCQRFSDMAYRSEKYLKDIVNKNIANVLSLRRIQTLSVVIQMPLSLDGLSEDRNTKPTLKKKQVTIKKESTSEDSIEKGTKVRLFESSIKKGFLKNKVTTKGIVKIEKDEQEIKNEIFTKEEFNEPETSFVDEENKQKNMTSIKEYVVKIEPEPFYKCDMCNNIFPSQENLSIHKKSHENEKNQKLDNIIKITGLIGQRTMKDKCCPICKKTFAGSNLVKHMLIHTGERPFICDVCGHSTRTKANLYLHQRVHTGEKVHCKVCNKGFTQTSSLGKHILIHTSEEPYSCHICGKSFRQSGTMRAHVRFVHEGLREYSCDVCNKRFRTKSGLQMHMNSHIGTKAYSCDKCQTRFTTNSIKNRHMKNHCKKLIAGRDIDK